MVKHPSSKLASPVDDIDSGTGTMICKSDTMICKSDTMICKSDTMITRDSTMTTSNSDISTLVISNTDSSGASKLPYLF